MRIGINLLLLSRARAGVHTYGRCLVEALARVDPANRYLLFVPKGRHLALELEGPPTCQGSRCLRDGIRPPGWRGSGTGLLRSRLDCALLLLVRQIR